MIEHQKITAWFPEIEKLQSADLREKTLQAFALAMERGRWTEADVEKALVSVSRKNCDVSLIEHIRDVTELVMTAYELLDKYYQRHGAPLDRDTLLCGALLHDLGKFIEYSPHTSHENGPLLRHPISGAMIAQEAGLPEEIVHIIATHSFEGDHAYRTPASDFIRDLDMFVFRSSVYGTD